MVDPDVRGLGRGAEVSALSLDLIAEQAQVSEKTVTKEELEKAVEALDEL